MSLLPEVRAAVVKAVPEIEDFVYHEDVGGSLGGHKEAIRPIRLADILRAIEKVKPSEPIQEGHPKVGTGVGIRSTGEFVHFEYAYEYMNRSIFWNLTLDNLDDQSEITIAFIHKILCV